MRKSHGSVLWIVLAINTAMFFVEGFAGMAAHSTSLLADALDMLGDALVYGFSLFVLERSARWQVGAALAKGGFMLVFGLGVMAEAIQKAFHPVVPGVETMGIVGGVALVANLTCFFLLYRYRADNLNMSSTWLCSRNDLVANVGVLLAAAGCYLFASRWPDIIVGTIIAALFLSSAFKDKRVLPIDTQIPASRPVGGRNHLAAHRGTPQGGPLSPLLSNILLDELDKELEDGVTTSVAMPTTATSTFGQSGQQKG